MKIISVALKHLSPHPDNPRGPIRPEDVAELAKSIQTNGLLCPLVVTPAPKAEGRFVVLAGHRRLAALKSLGVEEAACVVLSAASDADAFGVMLADNIHRVDLEPMRASALVAEFMQRNPDLSVDDVAKRLGKSRAWVAQSRAVGRLSPRWRKRAADPKDFVSGWGLARLATIAAIAPDVQEDLARTITYDISDQQLRAVLGRNTACLSFASWDLADPTIDKKAGPCTTCPKTSLSTPGLFEDAPDGDIRKAYCRDGECFGRKLGASVKRQVDAARAKHGPGLVVIEINPRHPVKTDEEWHDIDRVRKAAHAAGVAALQPHEVSSEKPAGGKGREAFVLAGKDAGKVIRVVLASAAAARRKTKAAKSEAGSKGPGAPSAAEKRETVRARAVFVACADATSKLPVPRKPETVAGLVLAYGMDTLGWRSTMSELRSRFSEGATASTFACAAWPQIRGVLVDRFPTTSAREIAERRAEAEWLAGVLGLPLDKFREAALAATPEPVKATKAKKVAAAK